MAGFRNYFRAFVNDGSSICIWFRYKNVLQGIVETDLLKVHFRFDSCTGYNARLESGALQEYRIYQVNQ